MAIIMSGVPSAPQKMQAGVAATLPSTVMLAGALASDITLSLTALGGTLGGVTEANADFVQPQQIQVTGSIAQINAALLALTFTPNLGDTTSIGIALLDSSGEALIDACYKVRAAPPAGGSTTPVIGAPQFIGVPPTPQYMQWDTLAALPVAFSVADPENSTCILYLTAIGGILSLTSGVGTVGITANTNFVVIKGSAADITATLANLQYEPTSRDTTSIGLRMINGTGLTADATYLITTTPTGGIVTPPPPVSIKPVLSVPDITVIANIGTPPNQTKVILSIADVTATALVGTAPASSYTGPTLVSVPSSAQTMAVGTAATLPALFSVADSQGNNVTLTLTASNGVLGGLTTASDGSVTATSSVVTLKNSITKINAALKLLTFNPSKAGSASIALSVTNGANTPSTATYAITANVVAPVFNALKTSGGKIIDSVTGQTVVLRSVAWFGAENTNLIPDGLWVRSYKDLIDQIAAWGFNCVRIPFSGDTFASGAVPKSPNVAITDNQDFVASGDPVNAPTAVTFKSTLACMDLIVSYMASKGLRVVFDHHRRASGVGTDGAPTDGSYTQANWLATWTQLASHYASFPNVCGADVHNEPYQLNWNDWNSAASACGNAILQANPNWLIFVEGVGSYATSGGQTNSYWWGGELEGVASNPVKLNVPNQLVYSPHEYGQSVGSQNWLSTDSNAVANYPNNLPAIWDQYWGYIAKQNLAPIWIGEFGGKLGVDGSGKATASNGTTETQWMTTLVSYIQSTGISFDFWCLNPNSGDTGGLLQDDWTTPQSTKLAVIQPILKAA